MGWSGIPPLHETGDSVNGSANDVANGRFQLGLAGWTSNLYWNGAPPLTLLNNPDGDGRKWAEVVAPDPSLGVATVAPPWVIGAVNPGEQIWGRLLVKLMEAADPHINLIIQFFNGSANIWGSHFVDVRHEVELGEEVELFGFATVPDGAVAVTIFPYNNSTGSQLRLRATEAQIMRSPEHAPLYGSGEDDGWFWLAGMEGHRSMAEDPSAEREYPADFWVGFNDNSRYEGTLTLEEQIAYNREAGVNIIRFGGDATEAWTSESSPIDWSQHRVYPVLEACRKYGMKAMVGSANVPLWMYEQPGYIIPEERFPEIAELGALLLREFPDVIVATEFYNEPNIKDFYGGTAADYTALMKAVYPVLKAAHPEHTFLAGSLVTLQDDTGTLFGTPDWGQGADDWLRDMYTAGAEGFFDAVSIHPYPVVPPGTTQSNLPWAGTAHFLDLVRQVLAENDDPKDLWVTETGFWRDSLMNVLGLDPHEARVLQARATRLIMGWLAAQPDVKAVIVHTLAEGNEHFGVIQTPGKIKMPAWQSVRHEFLRARS